MQAAYSLRTLSQSITCGPALTAPKLTYHASTKKRESRSRLLLPPLDIRLLPRDQGKRAHAEQGSAVGQRKGQSHRGPECRCVGHVVLQLGQGGLEETKDLIAQGRGNWQACMLHGSNQAKAKTFLSRLRKLNDHEAVDQGKCRRRHCAENILTKEEVLIADHIEDCKKGRNGI